MSMCLLLTISPFISGALISPFISRALVFFSLKCADLSQLIMRSSFPLFHYTLVNCWQYQCHVGLLSRCCYDLGQTPFDAALNKTVVKPNQNLTNEMTVEVLVVDLTEK